VGEWGYNSLLPHVKKAVKEKLLHAISERVLLHEMLSSFFQQPYFTLIESYLSTNRVYYPVFPSQAKLDSQQIYWQKALQIDLREAVYAKRLALQQAKRLVLQMTNH